MARLRRGSGVREHDLVARAKVLRESVDPLLPKRTADCPPERFAKLRTELEGVREARDDDKRLGWLTRWGDPLARSYAGLLKFYLEPSAPTVVAFSLPDGDVSFAPLAKAPRETEVAVQQSDEPARLLLGYVEWARRGFHFFATRRTLWCTGRDPTPPAEFKAERIAELPYRLIEDAAHHRYVCPHLKDGEPRPYLEVGWNGAGVVFRVCRRCAKPDRHLLSSLSDGAAVPDPAQEFPVDARWNARCKGGPDCVHARLPELPRPLRRRYDLGRLSDGQLLDAYADEIRPRIEGTNRPTLVAGGVCYGAQLDAFVEALQGTALERRAVERALAHVDGYFEVDEPIASRALERLWAEHAEEIVRTIVPDPEEARRWIAETRASPGRVAELLKRAQRRSEERQVLDELPRYRRLAREAAWVDRIAREYRIHGEGLAERAIVQSLPAEGKERGLAYGLLLALGRATNHAWQFSKTEQEFGAALADRARSTLAAPAARYHAALDALLQAAGVADWGEQAPGPGADAPADPLPGSG
ncbi:MAG TPA: hypothetical protein VEL82_01245 [Thermoplasmata archaeon]|nr:hypothetical protein [Thermoplasmata archaeon]